MDNNSMQIIYMLIRIFWLPVFVLAIYLVAKLIYGLWYKKRSETCNIKVTATCIKLIENHSDDGTTYAPEFEFEYQGQTRHIRQNYYSSPTPYEVGETYDLLIDATAEKYILTEESKAKIKIAKQPLMRTTRIILIILFIALWMLPNTDAFQELVNIISGK